MDSKQIEAVVRWLSLFLRPGQLTELRALHVRSQGRTVAGWFDTDHLDVMARHAVELSKSAGGVYFVPNPINPEGTIPGQRRLGMNKAGEVRKGDCTEDAHILRRLWLLIDADPVRPAGTKATDQQRQAAWAVIDRCRDVLHTAGYGPGIVGDSGNGWHLCQTVDMPNDDAAREKCRQLLLRLQKRCGTSQAKIDPATFNAARIWRLYGTINLKRKSHD